MRKKKALKDLAIWYYRFGFNVLPVEDKSPIILWEKWQRKRQTLQDVRKMNWNYKVTGVGGISGINDIWFIDIDKIKNRKIVDICRDALELPKDYPWITISGSKMGAHIIIRCKGDNKLFDSLGGKKGVYKLKLKLDGYCEYIEIRRAESQTVLPYSKHPSGNIYTFKNEKPTKAPVYIDEKTFIEFVDKLFEKQDRKNIKQKQIQHENNYSEKDLFSAIDILSENLDKGSYDKWLKCGFALASLGEKGRQLFHRLSLNNPNYKDRPTIIDRKFDNLLKGYDGRTNIGTLFYYAQDYGFEFERRKDERENTFELTKNYLSGKYDFQYNVLKQKLYWKKRDDAEFHELTDRNITSLFIELKSKEEINISFENLRRLLISNYVPQYDPLEDYFYNLPEWDGTDYIKQLSKTVTVEKDHEDNWELCLRKWLIATVAGALEDNEVNHTAIILQGRQGKGKTRWINRLMPQQLREYLYVGNITADKDSKLIVARNFLINLDELETLNRTEIGFLKSLMTLKDMQVRKPYGYIEENYKRRSSFAGSINKLEFLNDPTGSRRFLCFAASKANYMHKIDMDKVYSQAMHLYRNGETYWFSKEEIDRINKGNLPFTFQPMEEQLILENYEPCKKSDPEKTLLSSTEIAQEIMGDKHNNNTLRQIGMAMHKHGFLRSNAYNGKHSVKKWVLKRRQNEEMVHTTE